jgi:hypothetical protein
MQTYVNLYLSQFLEWEMFQRDVVEKIKTHILCSVSFSRKSYRLWDNVEKYGIGQTGRIWQYNTALALCMLGN